MEIKFEYAFETVEGIVKGIYTLDDISNGKLPKLPIKYARLFTGLKDKNGKGNDVYEGDIFELIYRNIGETEFLRVKAVVVFVSGCFGVEFMHPIEKRKQFIMLYKFLENDEKVVLGNIYEL